MSCPCCHNSRWLFIFIFYVYMNVWILFFLFIGHSVDLEVIEKLYGSLIEYIHQLTSDFSFATKLLHCVNFHVIMFEVKSLSRKVTLNYTLKTTTESHEPGKVYVADVTVTCEKKQLIVKPKVSSFCLFQNKVRNEAKYWSMQCIEKMSKTHF